MTGRTCRTRTAPWMAVTRAAAVALGLTLALAPPAPAAPGDAEVTSENDDRLKKWLERFPEADGDGDGVLTMTEVRAFQAERRARRSASQGGNAAAGSPNRAGAGQTLTPEQAQGRQAMREMRDASGLGQPEGPIVSPTLADVSYGPHERHVLDFWKAETEWPAPLLVCIHGGGFVKNSKDLYRKNRHGVVQMALDRGISVAAINYRYVSTDPFPAPFLDGARAVQFLRSKAEEWDIDPSRVAATGGSAGANISVWLATRDDLADPDAEDPVARESTRLSAVGVGGAQTFNDPFLILEKIGGPRSIHPSITLAFGVETIDELDTPEEKKLVRECSAIYFVTPDDPPMWLFYNREMGEVPLPPDTHPGVSIHHPMSGKVMQDRLAEVGVESVLLYPGGIPEDAPTMFDFFDKYLKPERPGGTSDNGGE